ncbi:MAG TPA: AAA family ATPase [Actinomycetota bacterium]
MLHGRARERAAIGRLLAAARAGEGGVLVVRGEPGIGKSALLADAAQRAVGMRVLRAVGVEAESALAYATLRELLHPVLGGVERLPEPQARALRVAFGTQAGEAPDRFLVSLAALTLLSDSAGECPLLCLVDDAHRADPPSLAALGFAARRLAAEPVALLLAVRDGTGREVGTAGLAELPLTRLAPDAAAALLDEHHGAHLDPVVRRQLLAVSGGNPLALVELPAALTGAQRAGRDPLDDPLPLAGELERGFLRRVRGRDPQTQTLLLLAAAEGAGRLAIVRRAAERLSLDPDLLESAALADLVRVEQTTLNFAHPLMRSAVYHGAEGPARRAAHQALAAALGDEEPERRAWHRARAADGPDETVAADLERWAAQTLRRSGHSAAAAMLEQAAELSPADQDRARRLATAAGAAWHGGATARSSVLLDRAERLDPRDPWVRLDLQYLRGSIQVRTGTPADGARLLVAAATEAARLDRARAMPLLVAAADAAFLAGEWAALAGLGRIAGRLEHDLDGDPAAPPALILRMLAAATARSGAVQPEEAGRPGGAAAGDVAGEFADAERLEDPVLLGFAGELAWGIGDDDLAYRLHRKAVARARTLGAAGTLAWALENLVIEELNRGRFAVAEAHALQGRQLALEADHPNGACRHQALLAGLAAYRGHQQARRLAEEVLAEATQRQLVRDAADARYAMGLLELGAGRAAEALQHLEALWAPSPLPGHRQLAVTATPLLVEAAVRAGEPERCRDQLAGYLAWAAASRSPSVPALAARCRALTSTGAEAERHFQEALRLHRQTANRPMEHAWTELLYGEFLRRQRRRVHARAPLRDALEAFERLGLPAWAERARRELRAAGQTARKRNPSTLQQLTPQELQVVATVGEGASNREAAARLFITPRTVAYHLHSIFGKLGISSRAELVRLAHQSDILRP